MKIDIKKLSKGSSAQDKARLLFANRNLRGDTERKENLIAPSEEEAIIEDARKNNQIAEINKYNQLYNLNIFSMLDLQATFSNFQLAKSRLDIVIVGSMVKGEMDDIIGEIFYHLENQKKKEGKSDNEVNAYFNKLEQIEKKYKNKSLIQSFDHFDPPLINPDEDREKYKKTIQPNKYIQIRFMDVVDSIKDYEKQLYLVDYFNRQAGFNLLSDKQIKSIERYKVEIDEFINLRGVELSLNIYKKFAEKKLMRTTDLHKPLFLKTLNNLKQAIELTNDEIKSVELEAKEYINREIPF